MLVLEEVGHCKDEETQRQRGVAATARAAVLQARRDAREHAQQERQLEEELLREAGRRKASLYHELKQQVQQARAVSSFDL